MKALRESRGIALLYFRPLHEKGVRGQSHAPAAPYPWERPDTHCTGKDRYVYMLVAH